MMKKLIFCLSIMALSISACTDKNKNQSVTKEVNIEEIKNIESANQELDQLKNNIESKTKELEALLEEIEN